MDIYHDGHLLQLASGWIAIIVSTIIIFSSSSSSSSSGATRFKSDRDEIWQDCS